MEGCDVPCQQKRLLEKRSADLVTATQNKESDPEGYERARKAYYTLKEGDSWLYTDNQKRAEEAVQPILDSYQKRFDSMKEAISHAASVEQARKDVMGQQVGDEEEVKYVQSEIEKERTSANVYQRLNELTGIQTDVYAWLPSFLDFLLGISVLWLVYLVVIAGKLSKLTSAFSQTPG